MNTRLESGPRVEAEIAELATYIGERDSIAGLNFLEAVVRAFERIRDFPEIGGLLEWPGCRIRDARVWQIPGFENYLILYRLWRDRILILHVCHGARDLGRILES